MTSDKPTGADTPAAVTSWPLAGPVSPCPSPASVVERMTRATAGFGSLTPWAICDRESRSWKTAQRSFLTIVEGIGLDASGIWPRSGTMHAGSVYELARPERPTDATACGASAGAWPTPKAQDGDGRGAQAARATGRRSNLKDALAATWPTPTAQTYGTNQGGSAGRVGPPRPSLEGAVKNWPTPTSADAIRGPFVTEEMRTKGGRGAQLPDAVNWPAPTVSDSTGGHCSADKTPTSRQGSRGLKGLLSPRWVEALQGWPLDYLGLPSTIAGPVLAALRKRRGNRRAPAVPSEAAAISSELSVTAGASLKP